MMIDELTKENTMKWDGKPGEPCMICGMDRSTDQGLCFDCSTHKGDNMKRIQLYVEKDSWIAVFNDELGNPDKEIATLFGTHHLPTAFRAGAPFATVHEAISKLNPGHTVTLS